MAIGIAMTLSVLSFLMCIGMAREIRGLRKDVDILSKPIDFNVKDLSKIVGKVLRERDENLQ